MAISGQLLLCNVMKGLQKPNFTLSVILDPAEVATCTTLPTPFKEITYYQSRAGLQNSHLLL